MRLLLIEDSQDIVDSLFITFQMIAPEWQLVSTPFGTEGMDLARSEDPDVILLDMMLPDVSGLKVLEQIRAFSTTPVVVFTVREEKRFQDEARKLGANDYIVKPCRYRELLERITVALQNADRSGDRVPSRHEGCATGSLVMDLQTCRDEVAWLPLNGPVRI